MSRTDTAGRGGLDVGMKPGAWLTASQLPQHAPARLSDWLLERGLLTAKINALTGCHASLKVISESWGEMTLPQQSLLKVHTPRAWVREIALSVAALPLIFAQTLVPESTLERQRWLLSLGNRSLTETLMLFPGIEHGAMEFSELSSTDPIVGPARRITNCAPGSLWARRRWVALAGRRVLVQEVFLPFMSAMLIPGYGATGA